MSLLLALLLVSSLLSGSESVPTNRAGEEEEGQEEILGWQLYHRKDYMGQGIPVVHCTSK